MGLIFGAIFSLISMVGVAIGGGDEPAWLGVLFGVGAIIIMPLFYGIVGSIVWMIGAARSTTCRRASLAESRWIWSSRSITVAGDFGL